MKPVLDDVANSVIHFACLWTSTAPPGMGRLPPSLIKTAPSRATPSAPTYHNYHPLFTLLQLVIVPNSLNPSPKSTLPHYPKSTLFNKRLRAILEPTRQHGRNPPIRRTSETQQQPTTTPNLTLAFPTRHQDCLSPTSLRHSTNLPPTGDALKLSNNSMSASRILGSIDASNRRKKAATSFDNSICARLGATSVCVHTPGSSRGGRCGVMLT